MAEEKPARLIVWSMIQPMGGNVHWEPAMRGSDQRSGALFSYVGLESRVRRDHPMRPIRVIVNEVLASLRRGFEAIYAAGAFAAGLLRHPVRAPDHGAAGV